MVKVCALPRYRDVAAGAAGTRLLPRPTSFAPDRTEFELERSGDDWEQIAKLKNFVLVIPIDSNLTDPHLRSIHREKV
jgi:predicted component of type VI protein secretion system